MTTPKFIHKILLHLHTFPLNKIPDLKKFLFYSIHFDSYIKQEFLLFT